MAGYAVFMPDGAYAVDRGQAIRIRELPDGESGARGAGAGDDWLSSLFTSGAAAAFEMDASLTGRELESAAADVGRAYQSRNRRKPGDQLPHRPQSRR